MKINVEINNNIYGKKKNYIAALGAFTEQGSTKEEAKQNLITAIEWYFSGIENPLTDKPISESGVTLILQRTFTGYEVLKTYHDGSRMTSVGLYGRITHKEALRHLESHADCYKAA